MPPSIDAEECRSTSGSESRSEGPPPRPRWIGGIRPPLRFARAFHRRLGWIGAALGPTHRWLAVSAAVGGVPLLASYATGVGGHGQVSAVLLTIVLCAASVRDRVGLALSAIACAFLAHCALSVALAAHDPSGAAAIMPGGRAYWEHSRAWIETGLKPEYEFGSWLPAHAQLLLGVIVFGWTSFGAIAAWEGFYEVDLMNYYVGQLLTHSDNSLVAIGCGWHPWSVCRGVGFLLILHESVRASVRSFVGLPPCVDRWMAVRILVGIAFVLGDAVLKLTILDSVRETLHAHLGATP